MKQQPIIGTDLMIFSQLNEGYKAIALSTSCTIDITLDVREISSKDSGKWKENAGAKLSWSGSTEHLCSGLEKGSSYDLLLKKMTDREAVPIHFTVAENADGDLGVPEGGWIPKKGEGVKGMAIITQLSMNAPDNENATMSISLTGTGPLKPDTDGSEV